MPKITFAFLLAGLYPLTWEVSAVNLTFPDFPEVPSKFPDSLPLTLTVPDGFPVTDVTLPFTSTVPDGVPVTLVTLVWCFVKDLILI